MSIFIYNDNEALGKVLSVDTTNVVVKVDDVETLRSLQVNRLVSLQSSRAGQHLIGTIQKITRNSLGKDIEGRPGEDSALQELEMNLVRIALIGTLLDRLGPKTNVFKRTLETVPEIDANCFAIEGDRLTKFMEVISAVEGSTKRLSLGSYAIENNAEAFVNGNKLFQRHALIVGSTGSGKSWTTARLLEQVEKLDSANAVVFDIHGEYSSLQGDGFSHLKVAGPADIEAQKELKEGVLHLPYWLLSYEALVSMFVDRTDQNAPNQAMLMSRAIIDAKQKYLADGHHTDVLANFTIDSPIPFGVDEVVCILAERNNEMVQGTRGEKQGEFYGKLSRLIQRLESKMSDRRLGFLFPKTSNVYQYGWLDELVTALVGGRSVQKGKKGGVKVIDFSEVPSDILPLIISMVGRLIFSIQQWLLVENRHPVALFCDEAHLYIPDQLNSSAVENSVAIFERIAKEGRKYGVGLVVISQRPAELNRTVVSQCNNLLAMRLTNAEDQNVVKKLLPDSLWGFSDLLPVLDTGEALVVGDATLLPTRICIAPPENQPRSGTINFWDEWAKEDTACDLRKAVSSWRKQSFSN